MKQVQFSENLKLLMRENELTQVKLASVLGVSQSAVSAWLSGKKEPSITSLWLLADYFDLTIDELIGRKNF